MAKVRWFTLVLMFAILAGAPSAALGQGQGANVQRFTSDGFQVNASWRPTGTIDYVSVYASQTTSGLYVSAYIRFCYYHPYYGRTCFNRNGYGYVPEGSLTDSRQGNIQTARLVVNTCTVPGWYGYCGLVDVSWEEDPQGYEYRSHGNNRTYDKETGRRSTWNGMSSGTDAIANGIVNGYTVRWENPGDWGRIYESRGASMVITHDQ